MDYYFTIRYQEHMIKILMLIYGEKVGFLLKKKVDIYVFQRLKVYLSVLLKI